MFNNNPHEQNRNNSSRENNIEDEINDEKSKKLLEKMENPNLLKFNEFLDLDNKDKNNFYLINKNWVLQFKKYYECKRPFDDFLVKPGKIDNSEFSNLFINDKEALTISYEKRLVLNNSINLNDYCFLIRKQIWKQLIEIYDGGPEYEIKHTVDNQINLVEEGGHIKLLFIPNKINNINDIKKNYIYFDLNSKVNDLKVYINKILNTNKEKFSLKKNSKSMEDGKDYRLWLYSTFYDPEKNDSKNYKLENYIFNLFSSNKNMNSPIDWFSFCIGNFYFEINLLTNFLNNNIKDIFPNKHSNFFDHGYYKKFRYNDEYDFPEVTIIIEQAPFRLKNDKYIYKLGNCSHCDYKEIVKCACDCKNLFFCTKSSCEKNYNGNHYSKCKTYLINLYKKENKSFIEKNNLNNYSLKGLLNLGNTCYMNSALQCMRAIKELNVYFLYYFNDSHLNINNIIGTGGFLTLAYINFLYHMNDSKDSSNYFIPSNFKNSIGLIDDRFADNNQQDSHEFLTFLIDSLHEDLNKVINKPIIKRKDSEYNNYNNFLSDEKQSIIEWNNFLKRNQSIMVDLFYGQYESTIICPHCEHKSINFSIYFCLQLPIPKYKENYLVKVSFTEEGPNTLPPLKFLIILNKQNNKTSDVKQLIGNILDIPPNEIEIVKYKGKEINNIFENGDEIDENINYINAIKINSRTIKENSLYDFNNIDYSNLKSKMEYKKNELIQLFENNNNDESYNDFNISIDINNNDSSFEKFIIKHYYLYEENISSDLINMDYLIYIETNKSLYDLYHKIYELYFDIIIKKYSELNKEKQDNSDDPKDKENIFNILFKDFICGESQFSNDIFKKYENLPFILQLKDFQNGNDIFIPSYKLAAFQDILSDNRIILPNENKNDIQNDNFSNFNKAQNYNENHNMVFLDNKNSQYIDDDKLENSHNQMENVDDNNNQIDIRAIPTFSEKGNNCQTNIEGENGKKITIQISKVNEDQNIIKPIINNRVKTLKIIWNPKFLQKKEISNNEYYLTQTLTSETIDLCTIFKKIFEENFRNILIEKCFEEFCKEETFDKDNLWKCSKCKEDIEARNKIEIYQTPKILIIQLKRFKNNQKIETFIDFPIKNLDINQFVSSSETNERKPNKKYDLFGVVNHYGRLDYGHYDAYCLNFEDNNWYYFNDASVKKINKEEINKIVTEKAYLLFYRQQNMESINWDNIYKKNFVDLNDQNMKKYDEDFIYQKVDNKMKKEKSIFGLNWESLGSQNTNITDNNLKQNGEIEAEEDNKKENNNLDELSLNSFVYNPFAKNYLKLKRYRQKKQTITLYENNK